MQTFYCVHHLVQLQNELLYVYIILTISTPDCTMHSAINHVATVRCCYVNAQYQSSSYVYRSMSLCTDSVQC